jgi:hypothetical protein
MADEKTVEVVPLVRIEVGTDVHEPGANGAAGKPFKVTKAEADRLMGHVPPSVRLAGDEDDEDAEREPAEVPLAQRSRADLDALATALGVDKPGDLPNKGAVVKAIEKAQRAGNPSLAD